MRAPSPQRHGTAETLVTLAGRQVVIPDGEWRMTLDLFDEGLRQRWFALDETPPSQWAVPRDYEIEAGDLVPVPSCWNVLKPEWTHFEGGAWYTRWFDWTPAAMASGPSCRSAPRTMPRCLPQWRPCGRPSRRLDAVQS